MNRTSRVELVPASAAHVGPIATRMRAIDVIEAAAFGLAPKQALRIGLIGSTIALTAKVDGRPEAMMGVTPRCLLTGEGAPWFLGTDAVYRHGRAMIRLGPAVIARFLDSSPRLANLVMASNSKAIRLLGRWGFTVGDEAKMIGGYTFLDFRMAH